jgi:hypothetical protein
MNMDPNSNFDHLRKLLAVKRYELPSPRYFNEFSGRVMARLAEPQREPLTWWQRLGFDFDLKPALMCGVGVLVCGLLSFGVIGAMQISETDGSLAAVDPLSVAPMGTPTFAAITPAAVETASIAPLITRQSGSPFNDQFALRATPVGFNTFGFGGQ